MPYLLDMGEGPASAIEISRASDFPLDRRVRAVLEPTVRLGRPEVNLILRLALHYGVGACQ